MYKNLNSWVWFCFSKSILGLINTHCVPLGDKFQLSAWLDLEIPWRHLTISSIIRLFQRWLAHCREMTHADWGWHLSAGLQPRCNGKWRRTFTALETMTVLECVCLFLLLSLMDIKFKLFQTFSVKSYELLSSEKCKLKVSRNIPGLQS